MAVSTDDEYCSRSSNVAVASEEVSVAGVMLVGRRQVAGGHLNDVGGVKMLVGLSSLPVAGSARAWYEMYYNNNGMQRWGQIWDESYFQSYPLQSYQKWGVIFGILGGHFCHDQGRIGIGRITSEVQNKMIFIGHQNSSRHVPVVRSFFIYFKII